MIKQRNRIGWIMFGIAIAVLIVGMYNSIIFDEETSEMLLLRGYSEKEIRMYYGVGSLIMLPIPILWIIIYKTKNYKLQKKLSSILLWMTILFFPAFMTFFTSIKVGSISKKIAKICQKEIDYKNENGEFSWRQGISAPNWLIEELDPMFIVEIEKMRRERVINER